jgi:hypothetical protein
MQDITVNFDHLLRVANESLETSCIANETSSEIFRETISLTNLDNQHKPRYLNW